MKRIPKKIWVPSTIFVIAAAALFVHNRPVELQRPVLMATPLLFKEGRTKPYDKLPDDIQPPHIDVFYATDRQPTDMSFLHPLFYGNDRSLTLRLGTASVRFGTEDMNWSYVEAASLMASRPRPIPLGIVGTKELHRIGSPLQSLEASLREQKDAQDPFVERINARLSESKSKTIYIFVPGFKVDFAYPVLVAAELWHYMGYPGAFIAYSWPSRQRLRDYLSDVETAAFTTQHFRMLLHYLAMNTPVENVHILSYSAGARIVSQALHELSLTTYGLPSSQVEKALRIGRVVFTAPDIDMMLFAARYRDRFEEITDAITIYTNANDTALNWALRFLGWPRLGAPGEIGLTPEDFQAVPWLENTTIVDVSAAEQVASGNGHGYFIKSPWVSSDLLLTLKYGATPQERGLVWNEEEKGWNFPGSYPQEMERIADRIHP